MTHPPEHPRQDPIVDEVRRNRERLLRSAGGTLDGLCEILEDRQAREPGGTVRLPPRKVEPSGPGGSADSATDAA